MILKAFVSCGFVAAFIVGCQPSGSVGSGSASGMPSSAPVVVSASPSVAQAPLEVCASGATENQLLVFVANREQAEFVLEIIGQDGACNWRIGAAGADASVGGVSVRAGRLNIVTLRRASDCAIVTVQTPGAGTYVLEAKGNSATFTKQESVDALGLGAPPSGPCRAT